jgi:hypothetical protein
MVLSIFCPIYLWIKYQKLEVNLADKLIKLNGKLIDISTVNEIHEKFTSSTYTYEYTFYEVVPMAHRKLFVIPMFFIPDSKNTFEEELTQFCIKNNVKRT